jgi:hypothetical protein
MKKGIYVILLIAVVFSMASCMSAPVEKPTVVEEVSWQELADQSKMQDNDNRYVTFEAQFLGTDAKALPMQALYADISNVILMNHTEVGKPYDEKVISSLDSFLIGLPTGKDSETFMSETKIGNTVKIVGRTKYINAGFGTFKHLLVEVESFEDMGQ